MSSISTNRCAGCPWARPSRCSGLPAGEVTDVGLDIDPTTTNIRGRVEIVSFPERLIARLGQTRRPSAKCSRAAYQQRHALIQRLVEQRGLRAQLRSGNLLTGQLFVALDLLPERAQGEDRLESGSAGVAGGDEHPFRTSRRRSPASSRSSTSCRSKRSAPTSPRRSPASTKRSKTRARR